ADALACAICHAHTGPLTEKLQASGALGKLGITRLRGGRLT
ncbi:MAG: crossover junction endodeoxyribonuclease RuvC, partial [Pusillimonas sp.]